eukprot:943380-Prorocentrum_minimum.AAC.2
MRARSFGAHRTRFVRHVPAPLTLAVRTDQRTDTPRRLAFAVRICRSAVDAEVSLEKNVENFDIVLAEVKPLWHVCSWLCRSPTCLSISPLLLLYVARLPDQARPYPMFVSLHKRLFLKRTTSEPLWTYHRGDFEASVLHPHVSMEVVMNGMKRSVSDQRAESVRAAGLWLKQLGAVDVLSRPLDENHGNKLWQYSSRKVSSPVNHTRSICLECRPHLSATTQQAVPRLLPALLGPSLLRAPSSDGARLMICHAYASGAKLRRDESEAGPLGGRVLRSHLPGDPGPPRRGHLHPLRHVLQPIRGLERGGPPQRPRSRHARHHLLPR